MDPSKTNAQLKEFLKPLVFVSCIAALIVSIYIYMYGCVRLGGPPRNGFGFSSLDSLENQNHAHLAKKDKSRSEPKPTEKHAFPRFDLGSENESTRGMSRVSFKAERANPLTAHTNSPRPAVSQHKMDWHAVWAGSPTMTSAPVAGILFQVG